MAILEVRALPMPCQGNAGPRVTAVRSITSLSTTGRPRGTRSITGRSSAAYFPAPETRLRSGPRLIVRCAPDTPPPPPEEPLPKRPGKVAEFLRKALGELRTNAFAWILLISCTLVGFMAAKDNAQALYLVNICEKSEKVHKFVSHLVPLLTAIAKCFK